MANPNPSPETRFKPGSAPNPLGKTSEHRRLEVEAAEMAARIRHKMLSGMMEKIEGGESPAEEALNFLNGDVLRLVKDSEDRAHGTPKATTEMTGANGGPLQSAITVRIIGADDPSD